MQQLSGGGRLSGKINLVEWMANADFKTAVAIGENGEVNATAFLPGPMDAWVEQAAAQCQTLQEFMNAIAENPGVAAQYVM
jgi:hypothetical protein